MAKPRPAVSFFFRVTAQGLATAAMALGLVAWLPTSVVRAGELDLGFGTRGRVVTTLTPGPGLHIDIPSALLIQGDGKLISVGTADWDAAAPFALVRYDTDGTLDGTFGTAGVVTTSVGPFGSASSAALQSDGKIVVAGSSGTGFVPSTHTRQIVLARYDTTGNLDPSFGVGGTITTPVLDFADVGQVIVRPDDTVVVSGFACDNGGDGLCGVLLVGYHADGTLDGTFGSGGMVLGPLDGSGLRRIVAQPDGKLVVAGSTGAPHPPIAMLQRYDATGTLDVGFGTAGAVLTAVPDFGLFEAVALRADGGIVAGGGACFGQRSCVNLLVRYLSDGSLDTTFGAGGVVTTLLGTGSGNLEDVVEVLPQADGSLIAVGAADSAPGASSNATAHYFSLAGYHDDGTLDGTFGTCGQVLTQLGIDSGVTAAVQQADGKIVVIGVVRTASDSNTTSFGIARYLPGAAPACNAAVRSSVLLKKHAVDERHDSLQWSWNGVGVAPADFGDPVGQSNFTMCVMENAAASPTLRTLEPIPAGGLCKTKPCWAATSSGFKYTAPAVLNRGITRAVLVAKSNGKGKLTIAGRGTGLALPGLFSANQTSLPYTLPVTVRFKRDDGTQCWEASYPSPVINGAAEFKASIH